MKSKKSQRNKSQARLAATAFLVIGSFPGGEMLHAQTACGPAPATDAKDLNPVTASPSAPDRITLWNEDNATNQNWMVHAQNTDIVQGQPGFRSPYAGPNSLTPGDNVRQTVSIDLYLGAHLWPGGELYFNPEAYQGYGFASTHGLAAFPNADAYKIGQPIGDVWIPHLFYRQTFGLGGEQEQLSSGSLQLAEKEDISRLTITTGRFAVTDQFDNNAYANDGRNQFMNWVLVNAGAFDYAADALGSTEGISIELNQKDWALRWGGFMVDAVQNGVGYDGHILKAWQDDLEYDRRFSIGKHPGTIRVISWLMEANMGSYDETVNQFNAGTNPTLDLNQTDKYRYAYGFVLNADQEITNDLGVFLRLSYRNGQTPPWAFTDIDHGLSSGAQLQGVAWGRKDDVVGIAGFVDELSDADKNYLEAGGQGLLVGDGKLNYDPEGGLETYYNCKIANHVNVTVDYQFFDNPGYNADRGPVNVFSARLHLEY